MSYDVAGAFIERSLRLRTSTPAFVCVSISSRRAECFATASAIRCVFPHPAAAMMQARFDCEASSALLMDVDPRAQGRYFYCKVAFRNCWQVFCDNVADLLPDVSVLKPVAVFGSHTDRGSQLCAFW